MCTFCRVGAQNNATFDSWWSFVFFIYYYTQRLSLIQPHNVPIRMLSFISIIYFYYFWYVIYIYIYAYWTFESEIHSHVSFHVPRIEECLIVTKYVCTFWSLLIMYKTTFVSFWKFGCGLLRENSYFLRKLFSSYIRS